MREHDGWDGAPDIRVLWNKTPKAKIAHLCECCDEEIAIGLVYENTGYIDDDGEFRQLKVHRWAYHYPSGCPKLLERDKAELLEQDAKT